MNSYTKLLYPVLIGFVCLLLLSGGAAAQGASDTVKDETNNWCIASGVTSGVGIADQPCTQENSSSLHQNVNISFVRSVHPRNGSVQQITPVIRTNTREPAEVRIQIQYSGEGNIKKVETDGVELTEEDIEDAEEAVENTLFYTYDVEEGEDLITDTYRIKLPDVVSQVSKNDLNLKATVVSEETENSGTITAPLGGFRVSETIAEGNEGEGEDGDVVEPEEEVSPTEEGSNIQDTDFDITLEQEFSGVSRFVDGLSEDRPLYQDDIPPRNFESGTQVSYAVGELINAKNLRDVENERIEDVEGLRSEDAAIVTSQDHPNEFGHAIKFGTAIYGIPQSTHKELNITYALATERLDTPAELKIVNAQGEEIDPTQDRTLSNTMAESLEGEDIDFASNEQFQYTMDEDLLSIRSETFELSAKEIQYINNNYEAYVTYEVDGKSGLLIFRSGILSSDKRGQPIIYNPQNPRVNEQFTLETGILATTEEADFTWKELTSGETLGTGKEVTNDGFETSGEKTIELTVDYGTNEETYTEKVYVAKAEFEDDPSTFNISYKVDHRKNDRFGTYDVEPEVEELLVPVEVTNDGDVQVERTVEIVDTFSRDIGGYEEKVLKRETINVPPKSTEERVFSLKWEAHQFGQHTIKVRDGTGDFIERSDSEAQSTPVYVYQPATLEVNEQILPDSWLVENNFTARITVSNVGDLSTNHPASDAFVQSKFGDFWSSSIPEFDLAGGSVRDEEVGQKTTRKYDREGLRYSPRFPQVTVSDRQAVDSPFGTRTGTFNFESEVIHTFMRPEPALEEKYNEKFTQEVKLYKMKIIDLQLVQGKIDETPKEIGDTLSSEIYPSPFPYTASHWTTEGEGLWDITDLQREQSRYDNDILDYPGKSDKDVIPYSGIEKYHPPIYYDTINNTKETEEEDQKKNKVYAKVTISNPGGDFTANARVKINAIINSPKSEKSESERIYYPKYWESYTEPDMDLIENPDKFHTSSDFTVKPDSQPEGYWNTSDFRPNVVSVAATDIEPYQDDQVIYMPIILPNNVENIGEVEFTVRKRDDTDVGNAYIERLADAEEDQFQERIQVRDFGDSFIQSIDRKTETIDMLCSDAESNRMDDDANVEPEGVSEQAGNVGEGNCVSSGEAEIDFNYLNRGSETVEIAPDLHFRNTTSEEDADTTYHHKQRTLARSHVENGLIINDFGSGIVNDDTLKTTTARTTLSDEYGTSVKYLSDGSHVRNHLRNDEFNPLLTGKHRWWDGDDVGDPWRLTLEPGEEDTITFDHSFDIPGTYRIQLLEHRILSDQNADEDGAIESALFESPKPSEVLSEYAVGQKGNAVDAIDVDEQIETQLTVLDSQEPSSRFTFLDGTESDRGPFKIFPDDFHTSSNDGVGEEDVPDGINNTGDVDPYLRTNPVHENFQNEVYNGLSSTPKGDDADDFDVIQGGTVKLDGNQRYYLHPEEARNGAGVNNDVTVSSDNVGVENYSWSGLSGLGDVITRNKGLAMVRINSMDADEKEVSLTVEDTNKFTNNDPNSDTETKKIKVKKDDEAPTVVTDEATYEHNYEYNGSNNGEFVWAGKPKAEDDNTTKQEDPFTTAAAEVTSATDNGIGIEKGNWLHLNKTGDTAEGEDNSSDAASWLCREFWPANDNPKNNLSDEPGHEIDTINNEIDNGACTGENLYTDNDFTGSDLPDYANDTSYTAIFDYEDRSAGTTDITSDESKYYVGFAGIDFAGNKPSKADQVQVRQFNVYNDTSGPEPDFTKDINVNTGSDGDSEDRFWVDATDSVEDYHDDVSFDACGTVDQGPDVGQPDVDGVGLHSQGDKAFKMDQEVQTEWGDCEANNHVFEESDLDLSGSTEEDEFTVEMTARDWYGNTNDTDADATYEVTLTGVVDKTDPTVTKNKEGDSDSVNYKDIGFVDAGQEVDIEEKHGGNLSDDVTATVTVESDGPEVHGIEGTKLSEFTGDFTRVDSYTVEATDNATLTDTTFTVGSCGEHEYGSGGSYKETASAEASVSGSVTDAHGNEVSFNGTDTVEASADYGVKYTKQCGAQPDPISYDSTDDTQDVTVDGLSGVEEVTISAPDGMDITSYASSGIEDTSEISLSGGDVTINARAFESDDGGTLTINTEGTVGGTGIGYVYDFDVSGLQDGGGGDNDTCTFFGDPNGCADFTGISP